jgi:hypothetical protein
MPVTRSGPIDLDYSDVIQSLRNPSLKLARSLAAAAGR